MSRLNPGDRVVALVDGQYKGTYKKGDRGTYRGIGPGRLLVEVMWDLRPEWASRSKRPNQTYSTHLGRIRKELSPVEAMLE